MNVAAAVVEVRGAPFALQELELGKPREDDVLVEVAAAVPQEFLPRLVACRRAGRFPVERVPRFYDFDQIDRAAHDAETGETIKPVLRAGA